MDYYAFTVGSAGTVSLLFNRPNNAYSGYFSVRLEDASGNVLGAYTDASDPQTFTFGASQAGTYYARIASASGYSYYSDQYSMKVDTVTDTIAPTVSSFSPGDEATGVAVGANIILKFSELIQRGTGTIYLKTSSGAVIESFDAATSSRVTISSSTFTLDPTASLSDGTGYRVEFSRGAVHDLAGNLYTGTTSYNFTTLAAVAADDHAGNATTTGLVAVGSKSIGKIEAAGDADWFAVNLIAGQAYQFHLTSIGLTDPYLRLYSGSGALLASNDDGGGGTASLISYTASGTGTYYLGASDYSVGTGSYSLSAANQLTSNTGFNIKVNFSGDSQYQSYFDAAAVRWSKIITGDLSDVTTSMYGVIDDLLINATVAYIDGRYGILGQAAWDAKRADSNLPYLGHMRFDAADLAGLLSAGTLGDVILHEMGHVLGLGKTLWQSDGLLSGSFSYTGQYALEAYHTLAVDNSLSSIPLETSGGTGTAGSHWSDSVFKTELMTGYAETAPPMPISIITVGALRDLGYTVDYSQADTYGI